MNQGQRTQAISKRKFLELHCSSASTPSPTVTLCAESKETALCLVKGGPGKLAGSQPGTSKYGSDTTYIRLDFQVPGNGRPGFRITPILAAPISFARIWASLAPAKVNCMNVPLLASISFLRSINVAMISAL